MVQSQIVATGMALGSQRLENVALAVPLGVSAQWIERQTGIRCRYWASEKETTADLAVRAAKKALERAGWNPRELDLIVLSTTSPDYPLPATACLVQSRICADRAYAFDVGASCSGFLYALSIADQAIRSGDVRRALVLGAEVKSPFLKKSDPSTAILFGDGAGALLIERSEGEGRGIEGIFLHADGAHHSLIRLPAGGSRRPLTAGSLSDQAHTIEMKGPSLFRLAVRRLGDALDEALTKEWPLERVNWFVFHQANRRILDAVAEKRGIPPDKILMVLSDFGNTSSASLPIALDVGGNGRFRSGDRIILLSFGGGITWGGARLIW